jgi:hypothetical protein
MFQPHTELGYLVLDIEKKKRKFNHSITLLEGSNLSATNDALFFSFLFFSFRVSLDHLILRYTRSGAEEYVPRSRELRSSDHVVIIPHAFECPNQDFETEYGGVPVPNLALTGRRGGSFVHSFIRVREGEIEPVSVRFGSFEGWRW